jgi:hypothetical protein
MVVNRVHAPYVQGLKGDVGVADVCLDQGRQARWKILDALLLADTGWKGSKLSIAVTR